MLQKSATEKTFMQPTTDSADWGHLQVDHSDQHSLQSPLFSHILSSIGLGFCGADFNGEHVNLF